MRSKKSLFYLLILTMFITFNLISCGGGGGGGGSVRAVSFESIALEDIRAVVLSDEKINGSNDDTNEIPEETIVVYQTNEGRYGKFIVTTYGYSLYINWVTYDLSNDGTVYSEGVDLRIDGTCYAELDEGSGSGDPADVDFQWEQDTPIKRYISPQNGATFAVFH